MEGFLAKTTYRSILKHAVAIDKDAALRAVLVAFPCSFYDRRVQQWTAVDVRQEWLASRRAVDDFVRELNGSSDWYLPHLVEGTSSAGASDVTTSASDANEGKKAKKKSSKKKQAEAGEGGGTSSSNQSSVAGGPLFLSGEAVSHVRRLYRSSPLTIQNLNNAFAAVKMLSYVMQLQRQLPPSEGELVLPDPRNLSGFEVLTGGISPLNHPSINEEVGGEGPIKSGDSSDFAATTKSAEEAKTNVMETSTTTTGAGGNMSASAAEAAAAFPTPTTPASTSASASSTSTSPLPPTPSDFGLQLLVAHPLMGGFFRHSIVMLSQAGEGGALGFIINKPVVNDNGQLMPVWSFIPDTVHPIFSKHLKNNVVFIGGPVASPTSRHHALFILHRVPDARGSIALGDGVYTTNDFNAIYHLLEEGKTKPEDVMVLLGYCGWGDGQLEQEERKGSWVVLKRSWETKNEKTIENFTTTADYVFSKNVVVDSEKNIPRTTAEPLRVVPKSSSTLPLQAAKGNSAAGRKQRKGRASDNSSSAEEEERLSTSSERSAIGEPRRSWVSLFGSLGPKYRSMARLADVRVDPYDNELFE